jgi:hypothetical protein
VGLIDECVHAFVQIGFDPSTDGAFMELQVVCNLRNTPSSGAQTDHFDPVSCAGGQAALTSALIELLPCGLG